MRRLRETKIDTPEFYGPVWSEQPEHYDTLRMLELIRPALANRPLSANWNIVDVGCGPYGSARFLRENFMPEGPTPLGIDFAPVVPELGGDKVEYVQYHVEAPPRPQWVERFDLVMAGEIIEHTEEPQVFASNLIQMCKVGGHITLTTVDTRCGNAIRHGPYPEHLWEFDSGELVEFFANACDVTYRLVGDYHCLEAKRRNRIGPAE